jgi:NAD-dependent DNA ligase
MTEKQLSELIKTANDAYYNENPILTDAEFDIIKEYMERKYPKNQVLATVGAPISTSKNKVKLPYEMASMDKIKPDTGALALWKQKYKGPYVLSCKLDGVSGMYVIKGTDKGTDKGTMDTKLYTRGDGKVGQDITHLISAIQLPPMNHIDLDGMTDKTIAVRGEFIIPKKVFDEKYKATLV